MSISLDEVQTKEFAQECINALADIKRSFPKTWKTSLQPYKDDIIAAGNKHQKNNTDSLLIILNGINKRSLPIEEVKIQYLFFLAAYCDML